MGARNDQALKGIRAKFAEWRRHKRHGEPVHPSLWDEFRRLEGQFGRTRLAKELGLNHAKVAFQMNLRRGEPWATAPAALRTEAATRAEGRTEARVTSSQTVAITKVLSVPFSSPSRGGLAVVEVESPSGFVLRLPPEASPDFLRAFVQATGCLGGVA
jgi:hypothetical protein